MLNVVEKKNKGQLFCVTGSRDLQLKALAVIDTRQLLFLAPANNSDQRARELEENKKEWQNQAGVLI